MKAVIHILKELKTKEEQKFIANSLLKRNSVVKRPDLGLDLSLNRIAELNEAISILENNMAAKPKNNPNA